MAISSNPSAPPSCFVRSASQSQRRACEPSPTGQAAPHAADRAGFVLGTISLQCRRLPAERDCPALIDVVHDPRLSEHVAEAGHGRAGRILGRHCVCPHDWNFGSEVQLPLRRKPEGRLDPALAMLRMIENHDIWRTLLDIADHAGLRIACRADAIANCLCSARIARDKQSARCLRIGQKFASPLREPGRQRDGFAIAGPIPAGGTSRWAGTPWN